MTIKAILFDFDGTIADTAPGIVCTMQETFKAMNLPIPAPEAVCQTIGIPLHDSIQTLGNLTDAEANHGMEVYRQLFHQFEIPNIGLFPNVVETLTQLREKDIRMAICTSRNIESLDVIMDARGLTPLFETRVTGSDRLAPKPAPDMVVALLKRMDIKADEAIVVGDTTYDIEMGNSAGCKTVAVTYGNHSHEKLLTARPTWVIDNFTQLLDLFA